MDGEAIRALYYAVMFMCAEYGQVCSLSSLITAMGWDYGNTHRRLRKLERRGHVRVYRRGRGRALIITPPVEGT